MWKLLDAYACGRTADAAVTFAAKMCVFSLVFYFRLEKLHYCAHRTCITKTCQRNARARTQSEHRQSRRTQTPIIDLDDANDMLKKWQANASKTPCGFGNNQIHWLRGKIALHATWQWEEERCNRMLHNYFFSCSIGAIKSSRIASTQAPKTLAFEDTVGWDAKSFA